VEGPSDVVFSISQPTNLPPEITTAANFLPIQEAVESCKFTNGGAICDEVLVVNNGSGPQTATFPPDTVTIRTVRVPLKTAVASSPKGGKNAGNKLAVTSLGLVGVIMAMSSFIMLRA